MHATEIRVLAVDSETGRKHRKLIKSNAVMKRNATVLCEKTFNNGRFYQIYNTDIELITLAVYGSVYTRYSIRVHPGCSPYQC